jgi:hypothetical protein
MARKPRVRPLPDLLKYRFDEPIDRFCDTFYVERAEARAIWKDMLRYLWLSATEKDADKLEPPRIVDEMWHMFLVYTNEYQAWSEKYFRTFVHHIPRTSKEKREIVRLASTDSAALRDRLIKAISTVWDHLGERTALRWYVTYPTRYDVTFYDRRRPSPIGVDLKLPQALVDRAMNA